MNVGAEEVPVRRAVLASRRSPGVVWLRREDAERGRQIMPPSGEVFEVGCVKLNAREAKMKL